MNDQPPVKKPVKTSQVANAARRSDFVLRRRANGLGYEVLVDGTDISNHVHSINISASSNELPVVTVSIELLSTTADIHLPSAVIKATQPPQTEETA